MTNCTQNCQFESLKLNLTMGKPVSVSVSFFDVFLDSYSYSSWNINNF